MQRRTFFKLLGLAPAALLLKPRRLIGPEDIVSDGRLTSLTIRAYQIVIDDIAYTDSSANTEQTLAALHDTDTHTGGVEYQA